MCAWKLDVYRSWDEVNDPSFIETWNSWLGRARDGHVFYHPVILRTWTEKYRDLNGDISPLYCVARHGETTFFLPLVLWRRNWKNAFIRMIVPAGFSDFDYHDPIVAGKAGPDMMDSFWRMIESRIMAGDLGPFDEVCFTGIRFPGRQASWQREDEACPYVDLSPYRSYEEFYLSRKKNLRSQVEKRRRQLSEKGSLTYHRYGGGEIDAAVAALPAFLESHSQRWPLAYKAPGLYADIVRNGIPAGLVHFSELRLDGKAVAWHLGYMDNGQFYYYMPAYLSEYHNYSPGKVLLASLMQDSIECGGRVFDFLRGVYRYKEEWADGTLGLYTYQARSGKVQSRVRQQAHQMLEQLKSRRSSLHGGEEATAS